MPYNTRDRQFGLAIETTVGTPLTLVAADYAGNVSAIEHSDSVPEFEDDSLRATLTRGPALKAARAGRIGVTHKAVGGAAATEANWSRPLRACGMSVTTVQMITVGSLSGGTASDLTPGKVFGNNASQGSATKLGLIVRYSAGSPNRLWYVPLLGVFASADSLTVYGSPTVTTSASANPVAKGRRYSPMTPREGAMGEAATVNAVMAGQLRQLTAARGTASFRLEHNQPLLVEYQFQGPQVLTGTPPTHAASGPIANVPAVGVAPAMGVAAPVTLGTASPIFRSLRIDLGNTLSDTPTVAAGTEFPANSGSGYADTRVTDRNVRGTVELEKPNPATLDYFRDLLAGSTFPLVAAVGSTAGTNGLVQLVGPQVQLSGDFREGDLDSTVSVPLALRFCGSVDDELHVDHLFN
jgi:hypothetical protein